MRALQLVTREEPASEPAEVRPPAALLAALLVGGLIRLTSVFSSDFPLNDGGLFYAMVRDLQGHAFRLPDTTSYNSAAIPFTYPPLGLYAGGLLARLTPLSTFDVLRFLPLIVSIATIGAFYLLARALLSSRTEQAAATLVFALLPRSSMWMIMGGGLTRSFGLLFFILALHQLHATYTTRRMRPLAFAMLLGGLTLLSHTEMSMLLLFSGTAFFVAYGRSWHAALRTAVAVAGAILVAAPWWVTVLARYGAAPFLNAGNSRSLLDFGSLLQIATLNLTNEALFPLLSVLGICGVLVCVGKRWLFLPAWLALAAVGESWVMATAVMVPLALLAGVGFAQAFAPFIGRLSGTGRPVSRWLPNSALGIIVLYSGLSALVVRQPITAAIPRDERQAMGWVAEHTPPSSRVLVISGEPWWGDRASEWFPVLGGRTSVATPQGLEWLPDGRFRETMVAHDRAQECAARTSDCLMQWSEQAGITFTHVFVSKTVPASLGGLGYADCCPALRSSLLQDPSFTVVYDGAGATVFALRKLAG